MCGCASAVVVHQRPCRWRVYQHCWSRDQWSVSLSLRPSPVCPPVCPSIRLFSVCLFVHYCAVAATLLLLLCCCYSAIATTSTAFLMSHYCCTHYHYCCTHYHCHRTHCHYHRTHCHYQCTTTALSVYCRCRTNTRLSKCNFSMNVSKQQKIERIIRCCSLAVCHSAAHLLCVSVLLTYCVSLSAAHLLCVSQCCSLAVCCQVQQQQQQADEQVEYPCCGVVSMCGVQLLSLKHTLQEKSDAAAVTVEAQHDELVK